MSMNVTIRQLRAFVTIARLNSFVEASRALHVTQAALSNVIRELESIVGFKLLERTTRRVRLSDAGAQYIPHAENVLAALHSAERCASDLKLHKAGVVRVATSQVVGWTVMAQPIARFHSLYPDVRIMPIDVPIADIRNTIETGQADMAISMNALAEDHIEATPLFKSKIMVVCRNDHAFAKRESVHWHELLSESLIFTGLNSYLRLKLELESEFSGAFDSAEVHEVGNMPAALGLVAAGIGIAICPGYVTPMTAVHDLRIIPCLQPEIVRPYMIFTNTRRMHLPIAAVHKQFLIDYFQSLDGRCVEDMPL